jgi:hypothetical protein
MQKKLTNSFNTRYNFLITKPFGLEMSCRVQLIYIKNLEKFCFICCVKHYIEETVSEIIC